MKSPELIGDMGEAIALTELTKVGIQVSIPFSKNLPYDYILDVNGKLYKAQCKTCEKIKNGIMVFYISKKNAFTGKRRTYSTSDTDLFVLTCLENNFIGLAKTKDITQQVSLTIRMEAPKKWKAKITHTVDDFKLEKVIKTL